MISERERKQSFIEAVNGVRENVVNVRRAHDRELSNRLINVEDLLESLESELEDELTETHADPRKEHFRDPDED